MLYVHTQKTMRRRLISSRLNCQNWLQHGELTRFTLTCKVNEDHRNSMLAASPNLKQPTKSNPPLVFILPYFAQIHHSTFKRALLNTGTSLKGMPINLKKTLPSPTAAGLRIDIKQITRSRLPDPTEKDWPKKLAILG